MREVEPKFRVRPVWLGYGQSKIGVPFARLRTRPAGTFLEPERLVPPETPGLAAQAELVGLAEAQGRRGCGAVRSDLSRR